MARPRAAKTQPPETRTALALLQRERIKFVNLQFIDVVGTLKSVTTPVEQFTDCLEHGKWFDGSAVEGFARIAESDMFLRPDLSTLTALPWERGEEAMARVICWVYTPQGERFPGDPRAVLARALVEAHDLGYEYNLGPEVEFFFFGTDEQGAPRTLPQDRGGYFDLSIDFASQVRKDMVTTLQEMGVRVETSHHEVAMGQHEIDFQYDTALRTADNVVTLKYVLKAVAHKHRLHVTFMPKPLYGVDGSGMHTHQSLVRLSDGKNAFFDPGDEYGLSEVARYFIAGQLHHARGMSALLCPLVNSYKRLVAGYEAPSYVTWARINRSALIRIPQIASSHPEATRVELRCPDPSCNPYLAFAVMLKCGLDGIKKRLALPPPVEENLYTFDAAELRRRSIGALPATLGQALDELRRDELIQETLGEQLYTSFLEAKTIEWEDYRRHVSQWELDHYLDKF